MNSPQYGVMCMGLFAGRICAEYAAELFAQNPADREGDLESGFSYWTPGVHVHRLVRTEVYPIGSAA